MAFDLNFWKQWEGRTVGSDHTLGRCLGGTARGAVFETTHQGRPAALKVVPGSAEAVAALSTLWEDSAALSHPHLVPAFTHGIATVDRTLCGYIVMERAEENLAEVLAERPLTPDETAEMLPPLLGVLQYLHDKGFAHGSLKPANIMAYEDQLKISADNLRPGGNPASDIRGVGTLIETVLGAGNGATVPAPFAAIAANARNPNTAALWSLARIQSHLKGDPEPRTTGHRPKWWGIAALALVIVGVLAFWPSDSESTPQPDPAPAPATATETPAAPPVEEPKPKPATEEKKSANKTAKRAEEPPPPKTPKPSPAGSRADGTTPPPRPTPVEQRPATLNGITQVMPDIPAQARHTISGRVRINVRVQVDGSGRVTQASPAPPAGSKYFTDRILTAARAWKFPAGEPPREWILHFELSRGDTRVSAAKLGN